MTGVRSEMPIQPDHERRQWPHSDAEWRAARRDGRVRQHVPTVEDVRDGAKGRDQQLAAGHRDMQYGSAVFEGIRCYDTPRGPAIFRLDAHLQRLIVSCRIYRMLEKTWR